MRVSRLSSQSREYQLLLDSWRDLQLLFYCSAISWYLLHDGIMSCWQFIKSKQYDQIWLQNMSSTQGNANLTPHYARTKKLRDLIEKLKQKLLNGTIGDSPKLEFVIRLIYQRGWMRQWQESSRTVQAFLNARTQGGNNSQSLPHLTGVTIIVVQLEVNVPFLYLLLKTKMPVAKLIAEEEEKEKNRDLSEN